MVFRNQLTAKKYRARYFERTMIDTWTSKTLTPRNRSHLVYPYRDTFRTVFFSVVLFSYRPTRISLFKSDSDLSDMNGILVFLWLTQVYKLQIVNQQHVCVRCTRMCSWHRRQIQSKQVRTSQVATGNLTLPCHNVVHFLRCKELTTSWLCCAESGRFVSNFKMFLQILMIWPRCETWHTLARYGREYSILAVQQYTAHQPHRINAIRSIVKRDRCRLTDHDHEWQNGAHALCKKRTAEEERTPGTVQHLKEHMSWADTMQPTRIRAMQWADGEHDH